MVAETLTKTRKDDLVPKGKERCDEASTLKTERKISMLLRQIYLKKRQQICFRKKSSSSRV